MTGQPSVVFGAVGDIGLHRAVGEAMRRHGADWPFRRVLGVLEKADVLFGNMESVFVPPDYPPDRRDPKGLLSPVAGPQGARTLRGAGFDFLNMAANHVLDAGTRGMFHTRECLRGAGIATGGVGRTQAEARALETVERNGLTIGFLCCAEDNNYSLCTPGPCHAYYHPETVIEDVRAYRDSVDILVVSIHADIEFMPTPAPWRLADSRRIAEAGADVILHHHPHVPQGIEVHEASLIAYSLGNFVFDSHSSEYMRENAPHTAESFVLLAELGRGGVRSFERVPVVINEPPEERPAPAEGQALKRLEAYFAELDAMLADDRIVRDNWRATVRRFLRSRIEAAAKEADIDRVINAIIGRLLFVAENRNVMNEVHEMAREFWREFAAGDNTWNRPARRL